VGTPHYRPFRVHAEHSTFVIQRPLAGPAVRGRRLPTPSRRSLATRKQLLQPSLVRSTYTCRQARPSTSPNNRRRPLLAQQNVVPCPTSPSKCHGTLPSATRLVLSWQTRNAGGGRATRSEHRGISAHTPRGFTPAAEP
jgi:hypothetical protein